ncbi:MAG: ABC transporter permease [Chloroflexia bacterium]|jgi:ABC-type polysaccharide/polyol phosphate export permease|nr:ABC transporter permease [Chloroflexia bacterium]
MVAQAAELIRYRSLVFNLVSKDLKVRYKNSVLGFMWSLLNPLLMMLVFTFVFTQLIGVVGTIENFPVFVLIGLLSWNWTATSVAAGTKAITDNAPLINKVYFPRMLLPVSVVLSHMIHYILALPVLLVFMGIYGISFSPWLVYLPVIIMVQTVFLIALVLILSALHVYFRDTIVLVEVGLTAWFFMTPIFYRVEDVVPDLVQWMYWLNPMASIIAELHTVLYYGSVPDPLFMARTLVTALVLLVIGYVLFSRVSKHIGEHL